MDTTDLDRHITQERDSDEYLSRLLGFQADLFEKVRAHRDVKVKDCEHLDPRELEIIDKATVMCNHCGQYLDPEDVEHVMGY